MRIKRGIYNFILACCLAYFSQRIFTYFYNFHWFINILLGVILVLPIYHILVERLEVKEI